MRDSSERRRSKTTPFFGCVQMQNENSHKVRKAASAATGDMLEELGDSVYMSATFGGKKKRRACEENKREKEKNARPSRESNRQGWADMNCGG